MKNQTTNVTGIRMLLGLTAIMALCMAAEQSSAAGKPANGGGGGGGSHGGGPGGGTGGSGGGSGGGSTNIFYPTVTNNTQLIGDLAYANQVGGTYTIYLQPNTAFTGGGG